MKPIGLREASVAMAMLLLIAWFFADSKALIVAAFAVLFVGQLVPALFSPFAWFWTRLGYGLSLVTTRVMLFVIFVVMVVPVSLVRRFGKHDALRLKRWKAGDDSLFHARDHLYGKADLENVF